METNKDLSKYRFEQAEQCLNTAKLLFESNDFKAAANRSYYCVFHSMRSLMALEPKDFKKHTAVIGHFRKTYIKTGLFNKTLSNILDNLFEIRTSSDYDDYYVVSKNDITEQIADAEYFLEQIKKHLKSCEVFL